MIDAKPPNRAKKDLNRLKTNLSVEEVKMKKEMSSEKLKKAFDRLEGCILFEGSGAELANKIRKNGFIKLKGA